MPIFGSPYVPSKKSIVSPSRKVTKAFFHFAV